MDNDLISRSALLADLREKGFSPAIVQRAIERAPTVDAVEIPPTGVGDLSDGYHTFNELYHHRAILFSVICNNHPEIAWKSMRHNEPNSPMYDGMFIVGIETPQGQATYHYDIDPYWDMFKVKELDRAPAWDGHTPDEAIRRIGLLGDVSPAVDAVEVVRCGKCKHWKTSGSQEGTIFADMEPIGACRYVNFCRKTSDFCSYGERKEGADNG